MVVDASVWVSSLVAQDVHHGASHRWLSRHLASGSTLAVPTLALAEVAGAISRRTGLPQLGQQAADEVLHIPGLRLVGLDTGLGTEAAQVAARYQLRGADAVYVTLAHLLDVPLVTWDQEVETRAGRFIAILRP